MPKTDNIEYLEFDASEWEDYKLVRSKTLSSIGDIDPASREPLRMNFSNALKWVNELRLICNHGAKNLKEVHKLEMHAPTWSPSEAQERFDQLDGVGLAKCSISACCQNLSSVSSGETGEHDEEPWISESLDLWCSQCFEQQVGKGLKAFQICNHLPRRSQKFAGSSDENAVSDGIVRPASTTQPGSADNKHLPTKIKRLIQALLNTPDGIKRFKARSLPYFTPTLANDLVQRCFFLLDKNTRHHSAAAVGQLD